MHQSMSSNKEVSQNRFQIGFKGKKKKEKNQDMNAIISYKSLKTGSRRRVRNPTPNEDEQTQIP